MRSVTQASQPHQAATEYRPSTGAYRTSAGASFAYTIPESQYEQPELFRHSGGTFGVQI